MIYHEPARPFLFLPEEAAGEVRAKRPSFAQEVEAAARSKSDDRAVIDILLGFLRGPDAGMRAA